MPRGAQLAREADCAPPGAVTARPLACGSVEPVRLHSEASCASVKCLQLSNAFYVDLDFMLAFGDKFFCGAGS